MGVYFIAAGRSTRNRQKTLDQPHRVTDLIKLVPDDVAKRLQEEFPTGEDVYVWGASERSRAVLRMPTDTYVVDVANEEVKQIFRFAFGYRTEGTLLQRYFDWDDKVPLERRRPYPLVYFLKGPIPTVRSQSGWFRDAFAIERQVWLPGQTLFTDREISGAMTRAGVLSIEDFLGISPLELPQTGQSREAPVPYTVPAPDGDASDLGVSKDGGEEATSARFGQGRGLTQPERRAVEVRAMQLAEAHYRRAWNEVHDVSTRESYDLLCLRGGAELRVEVKGTTGDGSSVILTKNEVRHAREQHPHIALFVVHGIALERRGTDTPVATGGKVRVFEPWNLDAGFSLEPETYRCVLPTDR